MISDLYGYLEKKPPKASVTIKSSVIHSIVLIGANLAIGVQ
jgi:hypothetical protein